MLSWREVQQRIKDVNKIRSCYHTDLTILYTSIQHGASINQKQCAQS